MKSIIIKKNRKNKNNDIFINVKMEEIFYSVQSLKESQVSDQNQFISRSKRSYEDNYPLWKDNHQYPNLFDDFDSFVKEHISDSWYFDFSNIPKLHQNALNKLCLVMSDVKNKTIIIPSKNSTAEGKDKILDKSQLNALKSHSFSIDYNDSDFYFKAYKNDLIKYIKKNCLKDNLKYPTGENFEKYILLNNALENNDILFRTSYFLSKILFDEYGKEIIDYSLFCHTLNGACLAENISLLLGNNVLYADRLNTNRNIRTLFMPDHIDQKNSKCIIITDLVCQGHELNRAKDIVLMLGGSPENFVGVINIGLNKSFKKGLFLITFSKTDRKNLNYNVSLGE